jgi:3-hydroxyisobutyrate dehydrogenase-like beta-hydroxyacid dehydrogenase
MRKWKKLPKGNVKGKLIVACSTIHLDTTAMTANAIEAHGGKFVACPVFGAPGNDRERSADLLSLRGQKGEVGKVIPYWKGVMGRANIDFSGQPPEKATLLKVIGNTFILSYD